MYKPKLKYGGPGDPLRVSTPFGERDAVQLPFIDSLNGMMEQAITFNNLFEPTPKINLGLPKDFNTEPLVEGQNVPYGYNNNISNTDFDPLAAMMPKITAGIKQDQARQQQLTKDNIPDMVVNNSQGNRIGEYKNEQFIADPKPKKYNSGWENYLGARLGVTALAELSGRTERARQDQYWYNQQSSIGKRLPVDLESFQPNPYRLYSRYGGKINGYKKMAGGGAMSEAMDFLFEDDTPAPKDLPTAPSSAEIEAQAETPMMQDTSQADLALQEAMYTPTNRASFAESAFQGEAVQAGQYGQQIIQDLKGALGYTPQFNSVYRNAAKQQQLVNQGVGVPNSWHLTGDAVDMKPADWNKLSKTQQNQFRTKYDVVSHNNHIHMEPKGKRMVEGGSIEPPTKRQVVNAGYTQVDPRQVKRDNDFNKYGIDDGVRAKREEARTQADKMMMNLVQMVDPTGISSIPDIMTGDGKELLSLLSTQQNNANKFTRAISRTTKAAGVLGRAFDAIDAGEAGYKSNQLDQEAQKMMNLNLSKKFANDGKFRPKK